MSGRMRIPYVLSAVLAALMVAQAALGLALPGAYRDVGWIRAAWAGSDAVTLLLGVPLLLLSMALARRGSRRATLLWLGMLGYAVYNYAFYLLGAAINPFFPLYVLAVFVGAATLAVSLVRLPLAEVTSGFGRGTPVRQLGGYLVFVGAGLACVWLGMWALHVFGGRPTPVEPEAFRLVAALDLTMMVPALMGGGVLLWMRRPWGYVVSGIAGTQGSLYLLVLTLNSWSSIRAGLSAAPGELPVWGPLALATAAATGLLLYHSGRGGQEIAVRAGFERGSAATGR